MTLNAFTFCCAVISTHLLCRTLGRSTALWVLEENRTLLPCTPRSHPCFPCLPKSSHEESQNLRRAVFFELNISEISEIHHIRSTDLRGRFTISVRSINPATRSLIRSRLCRDQCVFFVCFACLAPLDIPSKTRKHRSADVFSSFAN